MYGVVYAVTNRINGKQYVGQTIRPVMDRWVEHIRAAVARKKNGCRALYGAIRKHGPDAFDVEAVVACDNQEELDRFEAMAIEACETLAPHGYNLRMGGNGGGRHSAETRAKLSAAKQGRKMGPQTPEHRAKRSAALKGRPPSPVTIAASVAAHKGKAPSPLTIAAAVAVNKGRPRSPETRAKISDAKKGKKREPFSSEWRAKISAANRGKTPWNKGRRSAQVSEANT